LTSGIIGRIIRDPARLAGLFYLMVTLLAFVGALRLIIVPGEVITPEIELMARVGIVVDMIHLLFFLLLAGALFMLFSPVNRNLSLVVLVSISVSVAIQSINTLNIMAALSLLTDADYLLVFDADQVQTLAAVYLQMHLDATHVAEFFWFLWLFAAGLLIFRSDILPRYLGVLLMIGGVGYLLVILVFFLFPSLGIVSIVGAVFAGLAELSLMVWLLVKGANTSQIENISG
jgi:hypothetical protein